MTHATVEQLPHQATLGANPAREPALALPTRQLLTFMAIGVLLVAGSWAAVVSVADLNMAVFSSGMSGIGLVAVLAGAGVLILGPWKHRMVADWMTMWMAATVFRVLVTPIAAFVLYSAASSVLAAKPLALAVALTYMVALFIEAAVISQHLKRSLPGIPEVTAASSQGAATNGTHRS